MGYQNLIPNIYSIQERRTRKPNILLPKVVRTKRKGVKHYATFNTCSETKSTTWLCNRILQHQSHTDTHVSPCRLYQNCLHSQLSHTFSTNLYAHIKAKSVLWFNSTNLSKMNLIETKKCRTQGKWTCSRSLWSWDTWHRCKSTYINKQMKGILNKSKQTSNNMTSKVSITFTKSL